MENRLITVMKQLLMKKDNHLLLIKMKVTILQCQEMKGKKLILNQKIEVMNRKIVSLKKKVNQVIRVKMKIMMMRTVNKIKGTKMRAKNQTKTNKIIAKMTLVVTMILKC